METCHARLRRFTAAYSASNENDLFNAYYARREMTRLAGDVAGLEVLDAGFGSGPLMEVLRAKDAVVSGFDLSRALVELARQRLGEDAALSRRQVRPRRRITVAALRGGLVLSTGRAAACARARRSAHRLDHRSFICFLFFELEAH